MIRKFFYESADHFHATRFTKGCYIGQEVIARTYYRDVICQRMVRIEAEIPHEAREELPNILPLFAGRQVEVITYSNLQKAN